MSDTNHGSIAPCGYPGCKDLDGNPRLTREVICQPSRRHYQTVLDRLALHYVLIRRDMPAPAVMPGSERVMRVQARVYGHPREWSSDTARLIADQLSEAHDALAETVDQPGPPWQGHNETRRVAVSHHFLSVWFDRLCTMPGAADTAEALYDLDRDVRRGLGKTDPRRFLPVPCPNTGCGLLGLVRTIDADSGEDHVDCHSCGERIPAERYTWWTRTLLDELITDAEDAEDEDTPIAG